MIYTPLTKKALRISFDAHKNQVDKCGIPYVYHPFHLAEQMEDEESVCVALLHDVMEDAGITEEDLLKEGFSENIVSAIAMLTHDSRVPYPEYVEGLKFHPLSRIVKLADLRHNSDLSRIDSVTLTDRDRAEKYRKAIIILKGGGNPNVAMYLDTMEIFRKGNYFKNGKPVKLRLTRDMTREAEVILPSELSLLDYPEVSRDHRIAEVSCRNTDSFTMARDICGSERFDTEYDKMLVLNFANPVNKGGGVKHGANAQEEDLCRKSSLMLSLESDAADEYYLYNRSLRTNLGTDAMIISPYVEIIRDKNGELLDHTQVVSVLTCAAPYIAGGLEGLTYDEYREMLHHRIEAMLRCAAYYGYTHLVLGAWGCGAFRNDAELIASLFDKAMKDNGSIAARSFKRIDFAVLDKSFNKYNYITFSKYFGSDR